MAEKFKIFRALRPANTDEQDLFTLTEGELIGVVHVCNQDTSARTFRVAVTDTAGGVAAANEDFLEYDTSLPANTSFKVTIEGMQAPGTVRIKPSAADKLSFVLMGDHIT